MSYFQQLTAAGTTLAKIHSKSSHVYIKTVHDFGMEATMNLGSANGNHDLLSKVPQVTIMFWIIKILATTLGETGGDAVTMTLDLGYAVGSLIFLGFFAVTLAGQVSARRYIPFVYWAVVVATTTVGTTMSDYFDRSLGMGYIKSSIILFCGVMIILAIWRFTMERLEFENITDRKNEVFYWLTILVSNTLGTALGDFTADDLGFGFEWGAVIFAALIALVAIAFFTTKVSHSILFWAAYILTRPLGATLGDTLTKPLDEGGLDLGRIASSLMILVVMVVIIFFTYRRAAVGDVVPDPELVGNPER
ncbi:MAG TPA: hypothetical protein VL325_07500 [Pyrinomonadaceae bacterium]|nr:hypothetical protein [Pyrinomonadaceae bacterium]